MLDGLKSESGGELSSKPLTLTADIFMQMTSCNEFSPSLKFVLGFLFISTKQICLIIYRRLSRYKQLGGLVPVS